MNFKEWREAFLAKQQRQSLKEGLTGGVPLYRYKMSALEYADLKDCLKFNLKNYLDIYSIEDICNKFIEFPALFVLYAANWWQREGSIMNWEPIFTSIGVDYSDLNSNTRSQMIKRGFAYWGLVISDGGKKYIGNIAVQGGLPLKLIASDKNGNLNRLLKRALKEVVNIAFPDKHNIVLMIETHQRDLPESYRKPEIFELIAEIIDTFIRLKNSVNLTGSSNPIEKLNALNPNWRDGFPLPMDDENAIGVLERFVQEGARIKAEKQKFELKLVRAIRFFDDGFEINAKVSLPEQAEDEDSIKQTFGVEAEFISRLMTLDIVNEKESLQVTISRLAGQNKYRFHSANHEFKNALSTHIATLKSESYSQILELQNANELDEDSPWIFDADESNEFEFIKMGAGKFKSAKLYVVVNKSFQPNRALNCRGRMRANQGMLCYEVDGDTVFENSLGESFEIKPNIPDASQEDYVLRGERVWDVFQRPSIAFKGIPKLDKTIYISPTHASFTPVNAICKNLEQKPLNAISIFGPMRIAVKEQNHQAWASKIAVLPSTANFKVIPGQEANQGVLELIDWNVSNLKCLTDGVEVRASKNGSHISIDCQYIGASVPDEYVYLEIFWAGNPNSAVIKLPFPSAGVLAFDAFNQRLDSHRPISLREIYGVRIVSLLNQNNNYVDLELRVKNNDGKKVDPYLIRLKRDRLQHRLVIRLLDYKDQISDLLYSINTLYLSVEFRVRVLGAAHDFKLEITKYDLEMVHANQSPIFSIAQDDYKLISKEKINQCEMIACRVDEIDEVVHLIQSSSEGVSTGVWEFPVVEHSHGCWMVCPSATSSIQFKPVMLALGESYCFEAEEDDLISLSDAQKISDNSQRFAAINQSIEMMVENFNHHDWAHVEYLATHLGHLNLTSLDVWRVFAKNKRAMAALVLRSGKLPEQLIKRFGDELPFMWEFVSHDAWLDAAFYLKKQLLQQWIGNEAFAEDYFKLYLGKKLDDLLANQPSMKVIFEYIKHKNNIEKMQKFPDPKMIDHIFYGQLFDGETSEVQKLMQRDSEWPESFRHELSIIKQSEEHKTLFAKSDYSHRESVINLPVALAIFMLTNDYPGWIEDESNYLEIKKVKFFDYDWFANAFDITVARAIIQGYVQL